MEQKYLVVRQRLHNLEKGLLPLFIHTEQHNGVIMPRRYVISESKPAFLDQSTAESKSGVMDVSTCATSSAL